MYSKRIAMALLIAATATGCAALPGAPGAANAENPPAYVNVVRTSAVQVRLVPQGTEKAKRNQHPAAFQPDQVQALIASLRVKASGGETVSLTSSARMSSLARGLSKAFAQAGSRQDVAFVVFRRGGGMFDGSRHVTSGRLFYRDNTLNIIFGAFDKKVGPFEKVAMKSLTFGSRGQAGSANTQALLDAASWHYQGDRRDWVEMPATKAAIASAVQAAPEIIESTEGQSGRSFDYGPAAVKANTGGATQAPATPSTDNRKNSRVPTSADDATPAASSDWGRIEERLSQLKRLRDKNLITADDYQNKKDALLQQLP